uniref:M4 family metallopeptidase n=1 Tax=Kitasatospora setae TaxID=2066 RepID=UPI00068FFDD6
MSRRTHARVSMAALAATTALLVTAIPATLAQAAPAGAPAPSGQVAAEQAAAGHAQLISAADTRAAGFAQGLGLGATEKLVAKDAFKDADGTQHFRYERTYGGLPVLGGDLIVHQAANGTTKGVDRASTATLDGLSTTPKLAAAKGQAAALAAQAGSALETAPRLVVWAADNNPRLAWETVVSGAQEDGTPSKLHVLTDATSGAVIQKWEGVQTGTGNGVFVGSVTLGTSQSGSNYQLKDPTRGNMYTTNLNNGTSGTGTLGSNYVNAFWDDSCFCMTYGDGSGNTHPLTELDVAGHEMTHGVTSNTAGLNYSGESGGLNESTSDVFGTLVEFYANLPKDNPDYLIGELIDINGNGTPLRYLDKPSKDGSSADSWYSGVGNLDVHYSSGVGNHFFYLLSEGSGAKVINGVSYNSPTANSITVTGIGRDKAAAIWYRALTTYWTSTTNYASARAGTLSAATDLYGAGSAEYNATATAWAAVNVGSLPSTGGPTVTSPGNQSTALNGAASLQIQASGGTAPLGYTA